MRLSLFVFLVLNLAEISAVAAQNSTREVCRDCQFQKIADAIKASAPNDKVVVQEGEYFEHDLSIDRPLELVAKGFAVVDGENSGQHIFVIRSSGVVIKGFTIKNTGSSYIQELAGIRVVKSEGCEISGNHFDNTTYGVYLEDSRHCRVRDNTFRGRAQDEASGGNGIHLWQGEDILIENNDIQGHRDGIYFEFVKQAKVIANVVTKNIRYGLHFMSSNDCLYDNNSFLRNGAGVAVMYSRRINMKNNRFFENNGVASYGLLLKEIHEGVIEQNFFEDNTVGIFMEGSNRNQFSKNEFLRNGWAIRIMGDCEDNRFTHNNVVGNTFDVATNSERNPNEFLQNYWSQYNGYDLNHDGIGDIPYRPVNLSSVIVENVDSSFVLIKSFLLMVLDEIERGLPELIPERMKDEEPLMKPEVI